MVDWSMAVTDPLKRMSEGQDYVTRLYDQAAQLDAGRKYATGDYVGASQAVGARGDFKTAEALQGIPQQRADDVANQKIKQITAQHGYLKQAVPILSAIHAKAGPKGLTEAFQHIIPDLKAIGTSDEAIAQLTQAFQTNPEGTLQALGGIAQSTPHQLPNGDLVFTDQNNQETSRIKSEPKATPNQPFNPDGTPNVQFQNYERQKVAADALARRQVIVNNPTPNQAVTAGLTRQQSGVVRQKLNNLSPIENQIERVALAMDAAEKGGYTGYVAGRVPSGLDAKSDVFDKSVATLATLIRQLTRVPGEGAMSDYESRLASLTLPSRTDTPEGRRESLQGMRELIREIRSGYSEMLGQTAPTAGGTAAPPAAVEEWIRGPGGKLQRAK